MTTNLFLFGTQKSGTTWLRNIVDCVSPVYPNEWQLPVLYRKIENYVSYCSASTVPDKKIVDRLVGDTFKSALLAGRSFIDKSAYPCLPEAGCDDNLYPHAVYLKRNIFPEAKFVMIVRDPRSVFLSSCHYFSICPEKCSPVYLMNFANSWSKCNLTWLRDCPDYVLRFEDLKSDFAASISKLFEVTGLKMSDEATLKIHTRFREINYSQQKDPSFYRTGIVDGWRNSLPPEVNDKIVDCAALAMDVFGYV